MSNQQNKKIVIATGTFPPEISGQATFVSNLIKELPPEIATRVISYGEKNNQRGENIFIIKRDFFRHFKYWWRLRQEAKSADIIYAQDLVSSGLPAALAKRKNNKLIIRLGGDFLWEKMVNAKKCGLPVSQYYSQPKGRVERFYLRVYRLVISRCDKIIFNTDWPKNWYVNFFNIPQNKITVIENPIILKANREISNRTNDEIIFAGRFIPVKNLKRLIKAFKWVKTDKKLILIGEGPQKEELIKLAANDGRIQILDKMDQTPLWQRIASSFLFVLPSLSEFNPNLALEVLNLNKPVLLTKEVGFNKELKDKFKLIDPLSVGDIKEGIEYFLNQDNYNSYLEMINKNIITYSWDDLIKRHLKLFEDL